MCVASSWEHPRWWCGSVWSGTWDTLRNTMWVFAWVVSYCTWTFSVWINCSMSPNLSVCLGVNFDHESSLSQSPALLLLCRYDLPGLHILRLDRPGPVSWEGNSALMTLNVYRRVLKVIWNFVGPVKLLWNGGNMMEGGGFRDNTGSRVWNQLRLMELFVGKTKKEEWRGVREERRQIIKGHSKNN